MEPEVLLPYSEKKACPEHHATCHLNPNGTSSEVVNHLQDYTASQLKRPQPFFFSLTVEQNLGLQLNIESNSFILIDRFHKPT